MRGVPRSPVTEWGEQFATACRNAVAYLNVDSAASGAHFFLGVGGARAQPAH